jgi:hypothetical protein
MTTPMPTPTALLLCVVIFALGATHISANGGCAARGCNAPEPYSALHATTDLPTTYASTGFRADWKVGGTAQPNSPPLWAELALFPTNGY